VSGIGPKLAEGVVRFRESEGPFKTRQEIKKVPRLAAIKAAGDHDILVFMDGDASDDPSDLASLLDPILRGDADMVIGSRILGDCDPGSLTVQQRFGNTLACWLMHLFWGYRFTDLGPFRAIRRESYDRLNMQAPTFGWTVEMQVRALKKGLRCTEVPVHYRARIGVSKISGTVRGVVLAGWYILGTIFWEAALDLWSGLKNFVRIKKHATLQDHNS